MQKLFKFLSTLFATLIGLLILFIILSLFAVHYLLKSETIKNILIKQTAVQTGRQLSIESFSWSLFPTLHFNLNNVTLSNPPDFPAQPFMTIKQIDVGVKLIPLFHNQFTASSVKFDGMNIALIKNKAGKGNWEKPAGRYVSHVINHASSNKALHVTEMASAQKINYISIPAVDIQNINLTYTDENTGKSSTINNLNFHAENIENNQPFPFKLTVNFKRNDPLFYINMNAHGKLQYGHQAVHLINVDINNHFVTSTNHSTFHLSNLNATVSFNHQLIEINPLTTQLYEGVMKAKAIIDLQKNSYDINLALNNINSQTLLADLENYNQFTGTGNLQLHVQTQGEKSAALISNLKGTGNLSFQNSEYLGVDIGYLYRKAMAILFQGNIPSDNHSSMTKLGNLTSSFTILNGVLNTNNLLYISPALKVNGAGTGNLNNQELNIRLTVTGMSGSMQNLKENGAPIPFTVTGTFNKPKVKADLTGLLRTQMQNNLEVKLKKQLDKLPVTQNIKDQLNKIDLKHLF